MNLISDALAAGQTALSEYQSKRLLEAYGIPTTREHVVTRAADAVAAATRIGFPVALKACGATVMHKSDGGLMALHINSPREAEDAFARLNEQLPAGAEGILVQEMVPGSRELMAGLHRDDPFGPCVMVGLGGVMTEIWQDTAVRVAPFDTAEALDMIDSLRGAAILGPFRGQATADRRRICEVLMAIGRIGLDHDSIAEVDVNPLIITPDGNVVAVDALVVLHPPSGDRRHDQEVTA